MLYKYQTKGGIKVKEKKAPNNNELLNKTEDEKKDDFINVFNHFESANIRNREAFCELLNYSEENVKKYR